jgi:preprotein translocase subunit YajC
MFATLTFLSLLAEERREPGFQAMLVFFAPMIVLFYFIVLRPQTQERKKIAAMLSALKKNDRVLTAGGIIGTVANISDDKNEITLKVEDNVRIKFHRSFISRVLTDEKKDESPAKT